MRMLLGMLVALLATAASAAEKQSWGFVTSGDEVLLVYGVPESEAVTLSFICAPKRKRITVVTTVLPDNAQAGRAVTIRLVNGATTLDYPGKTGRDSAEDGVHASAEIAIDPRLYDLLAKGKSVRVEVAGARDTVPLAGVQRPLARMRAACK
jgi:hypothetical protein